MKSFAIALFDNEAESDDELTFKKNDLIQVMHFDYMSMEGWWLCKLVKTSQIGLAAGNRLKLIDDEKLIAKLNAIVASSSINSNCSKLNKSTTSSLASSTSVTSSSSNSLDSNNSSTASLLLSMSPSKTNNQFANETPINTGASITRMQTMSLQPAAKQPFVLPAKSINKFKITESTENILTLKTNLKKLSIQKETNSEEVEEEDDYDYDIPENNMPTSAATFTNQQATKNEANDQESNTRKSTSPTIDSGISTSSLMSLNSDNMSLLHPSGTLSNSSSTEDAAAAHIKGNKSKLELEFTFKLDEFKLLMSHLLSNEQKEISEEKTRFDLIKIKSNLNEFLTKLLKPIKEEHASFHPNLGVFNKFKTIYRQLKEFYLFYESCLNKLEKFYQWNFETIKSENELPEIYRKIKYLDELLDSARSVVISNKFFEYHSQTSYLAMRSNEQQEEEREDEYQYVYDNNTNDESVINEKSEECYENDYADYCQIDDDDFKSEEPVSVESKPLSLPLNLPPPPPPPSIPLPQIPSPTCQTNFQTLKKTEEKIKREIRIAANSSTNETSRVNSCDQMLLKFYLKHIEDNLNDLNFIHLTLMNNLNDDDVKITDGYLSSEEFSNHAHKLALNGHKLLFICDTLQRNLSNTLIKTSLTESSNELCDSLKFYMIRVKSQLNPTNSSVNANSSKLITESLQNVLNSSNKFKQIILKYYFKSY